MIVSPYSRGLRLVGALVIFTVLTSYIQLRPSWGHRSLQYARGYYQSVANYFDSPVYNNTLYQTGTEDVVDRYHNFSDACANFPDTEGMLLVMKTGATEAFDRVPTQVLTALQCLPDFLIFSDMEQQMGKYHIHDVLVNIEESAKAHNNDFDLYRDQKECPVTQKSCVDAKADGTKAWNLDKYKFLPMMEQTWRMRPNLDWYIFTEADTYVFWSNMVEWLRTKSGFNPKEKIYVGSRSFIGGTPFAHGGSGYVVSGMLLKHLIEHNPGLLMQYHPKTTEICCGDLILALAFDEFEGVRLKQAWPMFNGEKASTLPFGPGHWCEPILTMHHMHAEELSTMWQFEQTRKAGRTLIMKDLYDALIAPKMMVKRRNWDNLSDDICYINPEPSVLGRAEMYLRDRRKKPEEMSKVEKEAWKSPEHCSRVCKDQDVTDDEEYTGRRPIAPRGEPDSASAGDTEKAEDTSPSDASAREAWHKAMDERKRNRTCFQYRWRDEVCCISKSFKLGAPKAAPTEEDDRDRFTWFSGWDLKGINDWISAMGECKEPRWIQARS